MSQNFEERLNFGCAERSNLKIKSVIASFGNTVLFTVFLGYIQIFLVFQSYGNIIITISTCQRPAGLFFCRMLYKFSSF